MSGVLWTPDVERGGRLRAWYDMADTARIERNEGYFLDRSKNLVAVGDKSGLGREASQRSAMLVQPRWGYRRLNRRPVMTISQGDNESLDAVNPTGPNTYSVGDKGFCVVAVVAALAWTNGPGNDGSGTYPWDRLLWGTGQPLWSCKAINDHWSIQVRNNDGLYLEGWQLRPIVTGKAVILSSHYRFGDPEGYNFRGWVSGDLAQQQVASWGIIHPDPPRFGYINGQGGLFDVAEYIFLIDGEDHGLRQRTEGYLAHKWGISLATNHPYYNRAPLAVGGSSLMLGNTFANRLQAVDAARLRSTVNGARARFLLG